MAKHGTTKPLWSATWDQLTSGSIWPPIILGLAIALLITVLIVLIALV